MQRRSAPSLKMKYLLNITNVTTSRDDVRRADVHHIPNTAHRHACSGLGRICAQSFCCLPHSCVIEILADGMVAHDNCGGELLTHDQQARFKVSWSADWTQYQPCRKLTSV